MQNLLDILLAQILDGDKKEKEESKNGFGRPKKQNTSAEEAAKAEEEALKLEAEKAVERRAKKRLEELMKKEAIEMDNMQSKQKRMVRNEAKDRAKEEERAAFISSLVAPTGRMQWDLFEGNPDHLQAFLNGEHAFDIKRGLMTYKLQFVDAGRPNKKSMLQRAKDVGIGNNFSSFNVYDLKTKAETLLKRIESLEKKKKT